MYAIIIQNWLFKLTEVNYFNASAILVKLQGEILMNQDYSFWGVFFLHYKLVTGIGVDDIYEPQM